MKAVLAYSGGLDTSVCVKILQEKYNCEVITVLVDVGIPKEKIEEAEEKAEKLGVIKHFTIDAKEEFVKEYIFKAIKANGKYEGYTLGTALSRPLIALKCIEIARKEKAQALAHGATGKGNDQFRFEAIFRTKAPEMKVIAPIRELNLSRKESIAYAKENRIPISVNIDKPFSIDENLWGRSIEGGILEDPKVAPPEDVFEWTKVKASEPEIVEIEFENGVPVGLNGRKLHPLDLVLKMNEMAGKHGVGRIDMIEDRILGIKSREVYEAPAAIALLTAHKGLEELVLTREILKFKGDVDKKWGELIYNAQWTEPLRKVLDEFIDKTQERVKGKVKLRLHNGSCMVVARDSKYTLYSKKAASFNDETVAQRSIEGTLKYHALQAGPYERIKENR